MKRCVKSLWSLGLVPLLAGAAGAATIDAKGAASPNPVFAGSTVTTYVAVRPDPLIPGVHTVYEDIGAFGLQNQHLFDDGTHGDVKAGDLIYTLELKVPASGVIGMVPVTFTVVTLTGESFKGEYILMVGAPPCSEDFNGDGDLGTDADVEAFFACLAGDCCGPCGSIDFNNDGDPATDADIESFFSVLQGGPC